MKKDVVHWPNLNLENSESEQDKDSKPSEAQEEKHSTDLEAPELGDLAQAMRRSQSRFKLTGNKENAVDNEDSIPRIHTPSKYSEEPVDFNNQVEYQGDSFVHQVCNDFRELKINDIITFEQNKHGVNDEQEQISYVRDDTLHLSFDLLEVRKKKIFETAENFNESGGQLLAMQSDLSPPNNSKKLKQPPTLIESIGRQNVAPSNTTRPVKLSKASASEAKLVKPKAVGRKSIKEMVIKEKPERESSGKSAKIKVKDDRKSLQSKALHRETDEKGAVAELLDMYRLGNIIKVKDLEEVTYSNDIELSLEDQSKINEKILEIMTVKILAEQGFRQHTEEQIQKLTQQNKKQIDALQKMIKLSPRK